MSKSRSTVASRGWIARPAAILAFAVAMGLLVAHLFVPDGIAAETTYLALATGASCAAWIGAWRQQGMARRVAVAVAVGVTLSTIGDATSSIWGLTQPSVPDVSVADVAWVSAYVAIIAGLFVLIRGGTRRAFIDGLIDMTAVLVVALLIQWELVISSTLGDASVPFATRLVWAIYPALDAVLLAVVVRVFLSGQGRSRIGILVAAGASCWLLADVVYTLTDGAASRWSNVGWLLGAVSLAAATWKQHGGRTSAVRMVERNRLGWGRVAVALLPLLIPAIIELIGYLNGTDVNAIPLLVASVLLVAVAYARTIRVLQSERFLRNALGREKRFANALAENSSDAVAVVDGAVNLVRDAPHLAALLGASNCPTPGPDLMSFIEDSHRDALRVAVDRCRSAPGKVFDIEVPVRHAEGHRIWLGIRMANRLSDPDVMGVVLNMHDVTDRKAAEEELTRQAFHDGLTGLANRVLFVDRVGHALEQSGRSGLDAAVIYLDLDGFKIVNDSRGHTAGDELLRAVGDRLIAATRSGDTVARLGGDEFAILIEQSPQPQEQAIAVAERIVQVLQAPIDLADRSVTVSASVGIAIGDLEATALSLMRDADIAMYQAKSAGKARWAIFDGKMRYAAVQRLELEADLAVALEAGQFRLVYQPVIELDTDQVMGFEALIRWEHPRLGTLGPDQFIPIAEQTGFIIPIGRWVLDTACATASFWQQQFSDLRPLTMAVNVSGKQLADPNLGRYVTEALARSGLPAASLVLEITESALIEDPNAVAEHLHALHALGLRLAIDDFGTGYSSLSYLRQFPIDILKIDRSFINTIVEGEVPPIVRGLLDLGRTMQLEIVAEGIEQQVQHDALRDGRCGFGQGFLFARPLLADDAYLLLLQANERGIRAGTT